MFQRKVLFISLILYSDKKKETEKESKYEDDDPKTGIGLLKMQKKEKMIDDIWAQMQEDELRPKAKVQKTSANPAVPVKNVQAK